MCVELGVINVGVEFGDCGDHLRDRLWGWRASQSKVASRNASYEFRHIVRGGDGRLRIQAMSVVCRHIPDPMEYFRGRIAPIEFLRPLIRLALPRCCYSRSNE